MTSSDIRPPDLEMRVRLVPENGQFRFWYTLHSPTGVAPYSQMEIEGPRLAADPQRFQTYFREKLDQLVEGRNVADERLIEHKLAFLGRSLWLELFSPEIRQAYRAIRRTVRTWIIITDEPWIPWELIKPYDDSIPESVIDDDFLVRQFQLTRWLAGSKPPSLEIEVRRLAAIRTAETLPHGESEGEHLAELALRSGVEDASHSTETLGALLSFLETGGVHLLHFIGHGSFKAGQADESYIHMPEGTSLRPSDLTGPARARISQDRPLVFLNTCWGGQQGWTYARTDGWAARWVGESGCGAFIAPLWSVYDEAAAAFARVFYESLWRGETLGQAAQEAREHLHATWPQWAISALGYIVYGNPNTRVLFGDDANLRSAPPAIREKIIDFGPLIRRKTEGFVGRQWFFDAIANFVEDESRGYVQILGDPGSGKTTLIAELVKRYRHPHHFNIRSEGIQKPDQFLPNICAQLVARFRLGLSSLPPEVSRDGAVLTNLLEKAAAKLRPSGRKLLILVDALDESDPAAVIRGSNTLYLPSDLPDGVFFVVTSRRGGPGLLLRCPEHKIYLQTETESNFVDVNLFAESWLDREGIQAYIRERGLRAKNFVNEIVRLSEGNFMYLHYLLPEIEKGDYRDKNLDQLPPGLQSFYEDHWQRMRVLDRPAWETYKLPVLVALTLVKEPISMDLIANFSGVEKRSQIRATLDEWAAFLQTVEVEEDGTKQTRWQLYHDSFRDFIAAKDQVQDELVDLKAAHGKAADDLWKALYPGEQGIFQDAKQATFRIEKLEIRNFKNIPDLELDFTAPSSLSKGSQGWTCIAGVNGAGKTTILQALTIALLGQNLVPELGGDLLQRMRRRIGPDSFAAEVTAFVHDGERTRVLFLPLSERGVDLKKLSRHHEHHQMLDLWQRLEKHLILSYGVSRSLSRRRDTRYTSLNRNVQRQMTLFDPLTQIASIDAFLEACLPGSPAALTLLTLKTLLASVLEDELSMGSDVDRLVFNQYGANVEAFDLPDGYRSTVAWLADLCAMWHEMAPEGRPRSIDPADIHGIVLLDEIDLHLHPSLQRTLVPRLRKALPNVQFIVTTHSPLILSSFDRNELFILDQTAEGGVRHLDRQIFAFSADEIYEWLMGTRPQSTVLEQKLRDKDDPDLALYFYQSTERNEDEAKADLEEQRRLIDKLLGP